MNTAKSARVELSTPVAAGPEDARPPAWAGAEWITTDRHGPEAAVGAVLLRLGDDLAADVRRSTPVVLLGSRWNAREVGVFVGRCAGADDRAQRLASVRMETALVLRRLAERAAWEGPAYCVVTPGEDAVRSALMWAAGRVRAGCDPASMSAR